MFSSSRRKQKPSEICYIIKYRPVFVHLTGALQFCVLIDSIIYLEKQVPQWLLSSNTVIDYLLGAKVVSISEPYQDGGGGG